MSVVDELREYYVNQASEKAKSCIKGLDPTTNMIVLQNETGVKKLVSMDTLKKGLFNFDTFEEIKAEEEELEMIEEIEELDTLPAGQIINEVKEVSVNPTPVTPEPVSKNYTMLDFKNAVDAKDTTTIDAILSTFAVNPSTGLVDMDRAIGIITKNTSDLCIKCINENIPFENDLSKFNADGTLIGGGVN